MRKQKKKNSPSPTIAPSLHDMSRQQQQQQQPQQLPAAPIMEQLLHFMAQQSEAIITLQQQLLAAQVAVLAAAPIVEIAPSPKFNGERGQVVGFVNAYHLFIQMRMGQVGERSKISWALSYVQCHEPPV